MTFILWNRSRGANALLVRRTFRRELGRVVIDILSNMSLSDDNYEIVRDLIGFRRPLKIVVYVQQDATTVVTVYPLKKGRKK